MESNQQTTRRTRHMVIIDFQLQDWVLKYLLILHHITTNYNYSDTLTKATPRTLFYRHMRIILGKLKQVYVTMNAPP